MVAIIEGQAAPDFELGAVNSPQTPLKLADFKGRWVVLYFYPKDMTSGCTSEAKDFQAHLEDFARHGAVVFGVSRDSLASHEKFAEKNALTFPLLSDEDGAVCEEYGVYKEKTMYGRSYMGIWRTTVLIDPEGNVAKVYPKVKVTGHVAQVLKELQKRS